MRFTRLLAALVVGGVLGAGLGLAIRAFLRDTTIPPEKIEQAPGVFGERPDPASLESDVAWQYARAYQEGNWESVIAMTLWIQDRLAYVRAQAGDEAPVERERLRLQERLGDRSPGGNQLLPAGIEDQYVFSPGAEMEIVGLDEGRDGLERPVAQRTWIRVTFPERSRALRDEANLPIRSLVAGVNVSHEKQVLKAGIIGNLDIAHESISYGWPKRRADADKSEGGRP